MERSRLTVLSLGLIALFAARPASAITITWTFDGTLELVGGSIPTTLQDLGVQIGAPVHGFIRFDPSTPNATASNPIVGQYTGAIDVAAITIAGWSLARSIYVPDPTQTVADWLVTATPNLSAEQTQVDMLDPTGTYSSSSILALSLQAKDPTLFAGRPMPVDPPSLAQLVPFGLDTTVGYDYNTSVALYEATFGGAAANFYAELTSLQRVALTPPLPIDLPGGIPEPSTALLAALAGLVPLLRRA
jgi:hypothetical protein